MDTAPVTAGDISGQGLASGTWTGHFIDSSQTDVIYNRSWKSNFHDFFTDLEIPHNRPHDSIFDLNTIWGWPLGAEVDSLERDFALSGYSPPLVPHKEISHFDNYDLTRFEDYLQDLGDTEPIWILGNRKAIQQNGAHAGEPAKGFNRVPNHRANFAKIIRKILLYFDGHDQIWDHYAGQNWTPWTGKAVRLVEFWNEPYLNAAGMVESGGLRCFPEEPFWRGTGAQYADQFVDLRHQFMTSWLPNQEDLLDEVTLMAALNFPKCHAESPPSYDDCDDVPPGQLPKIPFTIPFMDRMQALYEGQTPPKPEHIGLDAVSVHWYVDTPDQFVDLLRNADIGLAHQPQYSFLELATHGYPEIWVTEWNRGRAGNEINYANTTGAAPFLLNGLYYLDRLYHGDFSHKPWTCTQGVQPSDWVAADPLHLKLHGAQVFGAGFFWTRKGWGPWGGTPKKRPGGLAWEVYAYRLRQQAPERMPILEGIVVDRPDGIHTQTNRVVLAGQNRQPGEEKIVLVASSIDRESLNHHPDDNEATKVFAQKIVIENFPYDAAFQLQREVAWSEHDPTNAEYAQGAEAALASQSVATVSYDPQSDELSFTVLMRKNSYEVYTITPLP
ncbi:MAG: hypothetical protein DWQ01_03900 [Planctomycetota bacterium]|nr:MAG: hypothetical protein DWQ01_03900 [Planctomycetota bacterium]